MTLEERVCRTVNRLAVVERLLELEGLEAADNREHEDAVRAGLHALIVASYEDLEPIEHAPPPPRPRDHELGAGPGRDGRRHSTASGGLMREHLERPALRHGVGAPEWRRGSFGLRSGTKRGNQGREHEWGVMGCGWPRSLPDEQEKISHDGR